MTLAKVSAAGAVCLALLALSCDRDRSNPLDPQADFAADRPATPAQVTAEAGISVIRLGWQPVADRDLAGYAVFRARQSNGTYRFVAGDGDSTARITTGKTTFADTVGPEATFFYRVAAVDTSGLRSELSAFAGATARRDVIAPEAPQSLSVVADEGRAGRVVLRWRTPQRDANGGQLSGLAGFTILRAEQGTGGLAPVDTVEAGTTTYVEDGLKTLTTYTYSVLAFDGAGNVSRTAPAVQVTTPGLPAPTGLEIRDEIGRVILTWTPVDDTDLVGYDVYRSARSDTGYARLEGSEGGQYTTGRTTYVDSSLTAGELRFYRIRAIGRDGRASESSTFVSGTAKIDEAAPAAPRSVAAVADENDASRITVRWAAPQGDAAGGDLTGLSGFVLLRAEGAGGALLPVDTLAASERAYVDTGLRALTEYTYALLAFDAAGNQSPQAVSVPTTTAGVGRPRGVRAAAGIGRITVSWEQVEDAELAGYDVYRATRSDGEYVRLAGAEGSAQTTGRTVYVDSNLAAGTVFFYKVQAVDVNGLRSELSTLAGGEALPDRSAPGAPYNVAAVAAAADPNLITLSWSPPRLDADGGDLTGLTGFVILRTEGSGDAFVPVDTVDAGRQSFADTGLDGWTTYTYAVVAFDAPGNEGPQGRSNVVRTAGLPVPAGLRATEEVGRIRLSWQAVDHTDLAGYDVYRAAASDGDFVALSGAEGQAFTTGRTTFVDSNLAGGTLRFYRVQAVGVNGLRSELSTFAGGQALDDESAPGLPRHVAAVADEEDAGRITVGWSAPVADADGADLTGLAGYVLLRAEGAAGAFLVVDTLAAAAREYTDSGLRALTEYRYALFAFDAAGNDGGQALSNLTRTSGLPTPSSLRAQDGIERITLTWEAVDSADLAGYDLYRATTSDGDYQRLPGGEGTRFTTGRTTYIDSGLTAGALYYYKVQAIGSGGMSGALSAFAGGQALADESAPGTPRNVSALASQTDPRAVTVRWTAPGTDAGGGALSGLAGFRILRTEGGGSLATVATVDGDVRQYGDTGLLSLTSYTYAVVAFDVAGNESPISATATATTIGAASPAGLTATPGAEGIALHWRAVDDPDLIGYNVYRSTRPDTAFGRLRGDGNGDYTTGQTGFIDSTLAAGDLVYYRVAAVTATLESEWSGFVSAVAQADTVAVPSGLAAVGGVEQVRLTWLAPAAPQLRGYNVYRSWQSDGEYTRLSGDGGDSFTTGRRTYVDSSVTAGAVAYYRVSTVTASSESEWSGFVSAVAQADTVTPLAGLRASGGITRITLSWAASEEEDLRGYNVYRAARSDGTYLRQAGSEGTPFTTGQTTYVDSLLTGGQVFFYRVAVVTTAGESELSEFDGATVLTDTRAPAAPTFVTGEPVSDDPEALVLSWRAPSSDFDGGELTGVQSYIIYRADTPTDTFVEVGTATTTSFRDSSLQEKTTYYYRVEALDAEGNVGPASSTAAVTTGGVDRPDNVRITSTTPSDVTEPPVVTITWKASTGAILRYEVERTQVAGSSTDADFVEVLPQSLQTTRTDDTVARGQTYYYRVRAVDIESRVSDWTDLLRIDVSN